MFVKTFIENSQALFNTLHDRVLIEKIIEIVEFLIVKMKKNLHLFSTDEINGLEIGRDIIKEGNSLFDELTLEEQEIIFELIIQIERDVLKKLFLNE